MSDDKKVIFSMSGLSKSYNNGKQVLKDIYLSFFYGAKIGILGLNGSGKSTLLKIIAGIEKSYQGDVVFSDGYTVGYLEQEPKLDESKTVMDIVKEVCRKQLMFWLSTTRLMMLLVYLRTMKMLIRWIN